MHLISLDESGNTGTDLKDPQQPIFVLAALIVPERAGSDSKPTWKRPSKSCCPGFLSMESKSTAATCEADAGTSEGRNCKFGSCFAMNG